MTTLHPAPSASRMPRPGQDTTLAVADRVDPLLAEMTLEETVRLTGTERVVGHDRRLVTPVEVVPDPGPSGE